MVDNTIPGTVERAMSEADRGVLPDNWSFQSLLRKYLEEIHPDPIANGKTRAEALVMAIYQGAMKQALAGTARADIVKLLVEEVGKDTGGSKGGSSDSLTDVQFLIVDPSGPDIEISPVISGSDSIPDPGTAMIKAKP